MGSNFSWQTEADNWEEVSTAQPPAARRRDRIWGVGVVIVTLLLAGGIVFWQVREYVDATTRRVKEEVLSSYQLVGEAAEAHDKELLNAFLSGRDDNWARSQAALTERGLLFEAAAFGLQLANATATPSIQLAPDLSEAELTVGHLFTATVANGALKTIQLQQSFTYRRGADRWLWSPPTDDYWGRPTVREYNRLRLLYLERDSEVALRLGKDLDQLVERICTRLQGLSCPPGYRVTLSLEPDPARLLRLTDWQEHLSSGGNISLPTPGLVGIPQDDEAYEALLRGYARLVAGPIIADLSGYTCCVRSLLFQAALEKQLSQLGIGPPLPPTDLALPEEALQLYCVARSTARRGLFTYHPHREEWELAALLSGDIVFYQQTPMADGSLLVLEANRRLFLLRGEERIYIREAPDVAGVAYALGDSDPTRTKAIIYQTDPAVAGSVYLLFDLNRCSADDCTLQPLVGWPVWSPDGQRMLIYSRIPDVNGRPELVVLLGDSNGYVRPGALPIGTLAEGFRFPFWLDDATYGFVRERSQASRQQLELVVADAATGETRATMAIAELLTALPDDEQASLRSSSPVVVGDISTNPANGAEILLRLTRSDEERAYFFLIDWQSGSVRLMPPSFDQDIWASFAPDGRRLALYERDPSLPGKWTLWVYDRSSGEQVAIGPTVADLTGGPLWSPDSQWLVNAHEGYLSLTAPASGYSELVRIPEDASCQPVQWLEVGR